MVKSMLQARRDFTREEILTTAERLFTEQGVRATTIGQVAEAVGMTRANLYYYFKTKEDLLRETLATTLQRYRNHWSSIPQDASVREVADHVVTARYAEAAQGGGADLRFFYVLLTDQGGRAEANKQIREDIEATCEELKLALSRGQERGEVKRDLDLTAAGYALIMEMMGLDMLWLTHPDAVDLEGTAERIAAEFVEKVSMPKRKRNG